MFFISDKQHYFRKHLKILHYMSYRPIYGRVDQMFLIDHYALRYWLWNWLLSCLYFFWVVHTVANFLQSVSIILLSSPILTLLFYSQVPTLLKCWSNMKIIEFCCTTQAHTGCYFLQHFSVSIRDTSIRCLELASKISS